ncbi:MAG: TRAP transporter small permease [Synergistaceae bacterium]|nr:TRAP transporter small permease [Synergistaceae bacterium]
MRISDRLNALCEAALFAVISLMTVVTLLQIVCRIWFKALTWSEELTCFLLVFASFFGAAVAFKRGSNIAVGFLRDALPRRIRRFAMIAIEALGIVFFAATGWYGGALCLQERMQMASSLPISMSWMYLVFPLTGAIVILHLCARIDELVRRPDSAEAD